MWRPTDPKDQRSTAAQTTRHIGRQLAARVHGQNQNAAAFRQRARGRGASSPGDRTSNALAVPAPAPAQRGAHGPPGIRERHFAGCEPPPRSRFAARVALFDANAIEQAAAAFFSGRFWCPARIAGNHQHAASNTPMPRSAHGYVTPRPFAVTAERILAATLSAAHFESEPPGFA